MTASGHESGGGDRVTGTGHNDPPWRTRECERSRRDRQRSEDRYRFRRERPRRGRQRSENHNQSRQDPRSLRVSRPEDREAREDRERERFSEDTPNSSPRRACSDEWGEPTEEEAERATGDRRERAAPGSSAREGAEETEASLRAPDEHPEALPPSHWTHGEREERKPNGKQHKVRPETPPTYTALLKEGRKTKGELQGA